ncbi:hypothetical protein EAO71_31780 [Streptomyces sp. ms191]|uniref:hypothetical protein n=1 Tax=unclassified Streptomyces TaxID=2593676 RepID=UPI0011CDE1C3|nr:hypothetical protein [Streptomyces sp. ms191]TXS21060.1 hypothetical protein EAO71_31780 [Streptomyces sp. ms191]
MTGRIPNGPVLYARSRGLVGAVAALVGTAAVAAWAAAWLRTRAGLDPEAGASLAALAPLLAAGAVGTSLHVWSEDLDRTAVRPWWPRRAAHLAVLTAPAVTLLALAVLPGYAEGFGVAAMVRNTLGSVGVTAAAAVLLGARLSWLPMTAYVGACRLAGTDGGAGLWCWPVLPGTRPGAWPVAVALFAVGAAVYVARGARRSGR